MDIFEMLFTKEINEDTDQTRVYCKGMPQWKRLEKARDILNQYFPNYPNLETAIDYFGVSQNVWRDFGGNVMHTTISAHKDNDRWQLNYSDLDAILDCTDEELEDICKSILQAMDDRRAD